ncbi:extracellular solute-binding protein [Mycetocola sp. 2940]|uniref:extracellular solute-binding protein n=1 Tax=Mycetocola sp. 2940 TaxID=3156452 RepID=UPI003392AA62
MQRRTRIAATASAAAVLLALTACGGGDAANEDASTARGDITIWYSNNEFEIEWAKAMVEAWNAENADEQIKGQEIPAGKTSEEVIGAAITAGTAPCLVFNTAPSAVGQFQKQGGLVDLASFEDGTSYIEERSGDSAEQYQAPEGGYFQMPWKANPVMIFYNKDMFAQAGLDPENPALSTFDDFLATSRTLSAAGVAPFAINPSTDSQFFQVGFDFLPTFAAESGGMGLVEDGKAVFADEEGITVANFWKTLYDEGLAGREAVQGDAFADGVAAMSIVGPWAVSVYGDMNWGSVPVPTSSGIAPEETYTFSDAKNVGLYTACKNQATAWDVLKFATSEEQDGQLLELTGQMPLRTNLPDTYPDYFEANPAYTQFGDQASRMVEVPPGSNTVEIMQIVRDTYSKAVISGEGDLEEQFKAAAEKVDALAEEG